MLFKILFILFSISTFAQSPIIVSNVDVVNGSRASEIEFNRNFVEYYRKFIENFLHFLNKMEQDPQQFSQDYSLRVLEEVEILRNYKDNLPYYSDLIRKEKIDLENGIEICERGGIVCTKEKIDALTDTYYDLEELSEDEGRIQYWIDQIRPMTKEYIKNDILENKTSYAQLRMTLKKVLKKDSIILRNDLLSLFHVSWGINQNYPELQKFKDLIKYQLDLEIFPSSWHEIQTGKLEEPEYDSLRVDNEGRLDKRTYLLKDPKIKEILELVNGQRE